jgi:repressor of nif and glnA expression
MAPQRISAEALRFLDEVSAPLSPRQIERALREHGISNSERRVLANALAHLNIIAVTRKEQQ